MKKDDVGHSSKMKRNDRILTKINNVKKYGSQIH
jgi:hypothetical protein